VRFLANDRIISQIKQSINKLGFKVIDD